MEPTIKTHWYELYFFDARKVLPFLQGIDVVITDPPFGKSLSNNSAGEHRRSSSFHIIGDENQQVGLDVLKWCENMNLPTLFFADPALPWPGKWRSHLVWDKGGAVGGGGDVKTCWKQTWELIQVARNGALNGARDSAVLRYPMLPTDSATHPAQKNLALMEYLINKLTQPAHIVLDPFMGSGTTGVACVNSGRYFVGIEIHPTHFRTAAERLEVATGKFSPRTYSGLFAEQDAA